jgi:hypothetical protein
MPEQRAVGFVEPLALALAFHRVRLGDVDGDDAVEVPCRRFGEEVEGQRRGGPAAIGVEREPEAQQRVDQPLLGALDGRPGGDVLGRRQIGDRAVEPAGAAQAIALIVGHEPVADAVCVVAAVLEAATREAPLHPEGSVALRRERDHPQRRRLEAQRMPATLAAHVLEVDLVPAVGAGKALHLVLRSRHARGHRTNARRLRRFLIWDAAHPAPPPGARTARPAVRGRPIERHP